jgi:hypothetical protein
VAAQVEMVDKESVAQVAVVVQVVLEITVQVQVEQVVLV